MPILSGHELAVALRRERPELRVLFISGHADHDAVRAALQQTEAAFVQKPLTASELSRKVRAALDAEPAGH